MRYEIIIFLGLLIIPLFLFFNKNSSKYTNVKIGNVTIKAEIADTLLKKGIGLMRKKHLPEDEGMLFTFDNDGFPSIWMMNMSFPIDIIWINNEKKVVHIVKDAQPCKITCTSYFPKKAARYVLEVNSNFTEKHNIKIGSTVEFDLSG
jgi:hypothetical protein